MLWWSYLQHAELDLSLGELQQRVDKVGAHVHLHDLLLAGAGADDGVADHALFHRLRATRRTKLS